LIAAPILKHLQRDGPDQLLSFSMSNGLVM
jgi:hypothetical protein